MYKIVILENLEVSLQESTDNGETWYNIHQDCADGMYNDLPDFIEDKAKCEQFRAEIYNSCKNVMFIGSHKKQ